METTTESRDEVVTLLEELVHLDYDAIEAYEAAIERLETPDFKQRLAEFCEDHRRHTENLGALLRAMGEEPPEGPDLKRVLTEGKVRIAGLAGEKAVLGAMRMNEEVTNKAYEKALEHAEAGPDVRETLTANLEDERRHRSWIESAIERL